MKKIILTTAALAFAGSAFAATVAGSVTSQYQKVDADKTIKTTGEVVVSGSKTASNGLTFGGTYKVKSSNAKSGTFTPGTLNATTPVTYTPAKATQTVSEVSGFVSGSFGKVTLGNHDTASELGGFESTVQDAVTYMTPAFSGLTAGYTYGMTNAVKTSAYGVKYATEYSGADVSFGYGFRKLDKIKTTGWELIGTMNGVTAEYMQNKTTGSSTATDNGTAKSMSLKYAQPMFDVKYTSATLASKAKKTTMEANYYVTEGLKVFVKDVKNDGKKETYIGTKISF